MILTFADKRTERVFNGEHVTSFSPELSRAAKRRLLMLHAATSLRDLMAPPGNRLEMLKGDRAGQHSIRINSQWRICFTWDEGHARKVEIVDYHR